MLVMQSPIYKTLDFINLSSPRIFLLTLFSSVLVTCVFSIIITLFAFNLRAPDLLQMYAYIIIDQTILTTFILATFFFSIFLYLLKEIDTLRKMQKEKLRYDHLTGVLNREAFLDDFKNSGNSKNNDAFLIIDADFFKKINDTHGHLAGDRALITITNALKKGIRNSDIIGRIGGEEFAVHLKNVNYELALEIAERLRENVIFSNESFDFEDVDLSVSIGVVLYQEKIALPNLMKKADELLYKAKENGRNRVEHAIMSNNALA